MGTVLYGSLRQHVASHEVDETRRKGKGNEQRRSVEDDCHGARIQVQNLFSDVQQLRQHCGKGGEEDGCVCHSRPVPNQDTNKASYQSRSQNHLWQGDEGQSQASQDRCEGLPRGCVEEADLKQSVGIACFLRGLYAVGIPRCGLEASMHGPELLSFVHSPEVPARKELKKKKKKKKKKKNTAMKP